MPKVNKLTEKEVVRLTPTQKETLTRIQQEFCIPKSEFIRKAMAETINLKCEKCGCDYEKPALLAMGCWTAKASECQSWQNFNQNKCTHFLKIKS